MKKTLILLNIFLLSFILKGQDSLSYERYFNKIRIKIYEEIIFSKKIKSNSQCHLVTIQTTSLSFKYDKYYLGFHNIREIEDTISVEKLRKNVPSSYLIYPVNRKLTNIMTGKNYIDYYKESDTLYSYKTDCNDFDIIKIYEPFDKWSKLYESYYQGFNNLKIVVPVKYELPDNKEKYLLFKFQFNKSGEIQKIKNTEI